jgi:hypothetical protein
MMNLQRTIQSSWHVGDDKIPTRDSEILLSLQIIEESALIHRGDLPGVDAFLSEYQNPAWMLDLNTANLGVSRDLFLTHHQESGARFDEVDRSELS